MNNKNEFKTLKAFNSGSFNLQIVQIRFEIIAN